MAKKNVLGRGLGALIADAVDEPVTRVGCIGHAGVEFGGYTPQSFSAPYGV